MIIITWVRRGAKDKCDNYDIIRVYEVCYTYTTGSSALPDIYIWPEGVSVYIRQNMSACGISAIYHIAYAGW